jgi:hypothetical protein
MRTYQLLLPLALGLVGCKWTDFDDIEDTTWVRSTEDSDLGANEYAVAIAGVSQGSSGGMLAVISDDTPNYSTIDYNSAGGDDLGPSPIKLGTHNIGVLGEAPVFTTDASGRIGLVEKSITGGNFAVMFGSPTAPNALEFMAETNSPTPTPAAAVFLGSDLLFVAGDYFYTVKAAGGMPDTCQAEDENMMPLDAAGMGADATNVYVWTKGGKLLTYAIADITACAATLVPSASPMPFETTGLMPAAGARVHVSGNFAILAGKSMTSITGQVFVVNLTTMTQEGMTVTIEGLTSSVLADYGTGTYLAVGVPARPVGGVAAGAVDLFEFTPTSGVLIEQPMTTLHDADPDSGQRFGRSVTTMSFNGNPILVVGTRAEVFAYFKTDLYDHLP